MKANQRVVITGMGTIAPGNSLNVDNFWNILISGESTADTITQFDATNYNSRFACEVKGFDPLNFM
ncbi:MAG TPA: beta-ketoacyl synthase N-terminal-like domain-containing protein, partial [bacterium]|nr:beta-ketoacyl synthase N-terminal-like domain-containing protein [bacterium]